MRDELFCFSFREIVEMLESEIAGDHERSLRSSIIHFVLGDPRERQRLGVKSIPEGFPILTIRAPVPWHQAKLMADHNMEHNLFIGNEIARDIRDIWYER